MKVEILTNGYGRETQLYFDGQRVSGVTHISLEIPADSVAELTVERLVIPTNPTTDRSIYTELEAGAIEPSRDQTLRFIGSVEPVTAQFEGGEAMNPIKVFPDGDQWCALLGEDLQAGEAEFAETPTQALALLLRRLNAESEARLWTQ